MVDRIERNKDLIQEGVESTATHVGRIATIITGAVTDIAREIGELITDGFEMREAARRARADESRHATDAAPDDSGATDLDIEGSLEAPVVPQELEGPADRASAADPVADEDPTGAGDGVTLEGTMEAPVAPSDE
ncbi:hypothetical protein ACLQ3C_08950 [Gordonia sp. DT30]|uniref:hypothetical protein n=1 Tax=unclassified Gordonia (in: high G+C Gram-positive bacteria) TaxID=2657482 RepID=UPI003CEE1B0E